MKIIRKIAAFSILVLIMSSCSRNSYNYLQVKHVDDLEMGHNMQGFYYALPRTVLLVELNVVRSEDIPGPFAQFAGKYLGIDNVIMQRSVRHRIADISITSYAEPDPHEYYFVEFNPRVHQNNPFSFTLSESGMITCINTLGERIEITEEVALRSGFRQLSSQAAFNYFIKNNIQERIDTIIERVRMDTAVVERQTLRRVWVEKTSDVRAREVADYIMRIRNKKFDLISGFAEITYSKEALQYMHDKLEQQENDYLELFTGITTENRTRYKFTIVPSTDMINREEILFHFSESEGLFTESRRGTEPVAIQIGRHHSTQKPAAILRDETINTGFWYRTPEYGNVTLTRRNNVVAEKRLLISQFGLINSLPAGDFKIEFYPATGALKSVEKINREK
jgi:hypothetical protein